MRRTALGLVVALSLAAAVVASTAQAAPKMLIGLFDEGETLYDDPEYTFPLYKTLRTQMLRVGLHWGGGALSVAKDRPAAATDPDDPEYDWSIYDRTVFYAHANKIQVLFSIVDTPRWANGGQSTNRPPKSFRDLQNFAVAAAKRYSGKWQDADGRTIPAVRHWAAWNEPNNPVFLRPQYVKKAGKWVIQSAIDYAQICNAIYTGIKTSFKTAKVACGVTGPRGNNNPASTRPSVSPIAFLAAAKKAGMKTFDAYAHHPYYGQPNETPTTKPPAARGAAPTAVTLGNIGTLILELSKLYGPKRVWITEYGYQTKPPDSQFGVSYAQQAAYLSQAFAIARKHPRIDMMLWFLAKDEPNVAGWQSGLTTADRKRKPAFNTFRNLPR